MRPAFEATQEQRELVNLLASMGVAQEDIAKVVKIGERTLRKYFKEELATATIKANAKVAGALFRMATDPKGGMKAVTAQIFWLKTRARWRETDPAEQQASTQHRIEVSLVSPGQINSRSNPPASPENRNGKDSS